MVKRLFQPIRRWLAGQLTAAPREDFGATFITAPVGPGLAGAMVTMPGLPSTEPFHPSPMAAPPPVSPASVELRFVRLHVEGRFDEMWDLLVEDAQRAWGSRENFYREMPRLDQWMEILDLNVVDVKILESWTDLLHQRTYGNVARLVMRYRVRQQWREWTFDRQVHLVPAAGGWRTLCYPMRARTAATH